MALIESISICETTSIRDALAAIDRSGRIGVALILDGQCRLLNTLTDGDVRRGLLSGLSIDDCAGSLLEIKKRMPHPVPVVCSDQSTVEERVNLAIASGVRQLPVIDEDGRVKDVFVLRDLLENQSARPQAVVMAGGFGKRLMPLTEHTPKPMLLVGGRPMLEIVLERLSKSGIKKFHVTTHYKPEKILEYFGDGKSFGVDINYLNEASPMGTAGALSRIGRPDGDLLVINGDVLTDLDFGKMFEYHSQNGAVLTVAVRPYEHVVPFGVVRLSDFEVTSIEEKPTQVWHVSAGIYVLSPSALDFVKEDEHLDMPELITRLISAGCRVSSFLIQESWVDVGRFDDYERAVQEAAT